MEPADWIEEIEEVSAQRQWLKIGYDNGWISDAIAYLKTTPAVTLTGKGGGYELLESYLMGEEQ